jgi:hypothetical protein
MPKQKKVTRVKKAARAKGAKGPAALVTALNRTTAALKAHQKTLESHTAVMTAHAVALTPADARGACTVLFTDNRPNYCENNRTNRECQELGAEMGGIARPVIPGQKCFTE